MGGWYASTLADTAFQLRGACAPEVHKPARPEDTNVATLRM
jgi:hypothetical protein